MHNCLDPRQYPEPVKECWAVHQALRSLGFPAEDIFLGSGRDAALPSAAVSLFVILRTQDKEFIVTLGGYPSEAEADAAITLWSTFAQLFNGSSPGKSRPNRHNNMICQRKMQI